jgi:hypothetical protein
MHNVVMLGAFTIDKVLLGHVVRKRMGEEGKEKAEIFFFSKVKKSVAFDRSLKLSFMAICSPDLNFLKSKDS